MRIFIQIILPLITPIIIYFLWTFWEAKRKGKGIPGWEEGNWFWAILAGIFLSIFTLFYLTTTGADTNSEYRSPRLENGRIVPGHHKEQF